MGETPESLKKYLTGPEVAGFLEACNVLYSLVKDNYKNMQPMASKSYKTKHGKQYEDTLISLTAQCRRCDHKVIATIATSQEGSARTLAEYFLVRCEFHTRKKHRILIPKGKSVLQ
ncbi:MAG TPA: hypothetical protein V6D22_13745 [Candidatus Obscuribacterales bacterium]